MTVKSRSRKYYPDPKDIRKQVPLLWPIVIMFVVTVIYALGLRNEMARTILLYVSLAFPAIIVLSLLSAMPKSNYYQIDSAGVHVTVLGIIRKHIYWSDIGSIGPAVIGNVEGIGMMYVNSFDRRVWGRKTRQKMWGWDEILANAHTEDGASFGSEVTRYFKKHLRATNRQIAKEAY